MQPDIWYRGFYLKMNAQNNTHKSLYSKKRQPKQVDNIVIEKDDGFELDWDSIEENVKISQQHRRIRHSANRHKHNISTSDGFKHTINNNLESQCDISANSSSNDNHIRTHLKHTIHIDEKSEKKTKSPALKILIVLIILILFIAIGLFISFALLRYKGEKALFTTESINIETIEGAETPNKGQTVTYNGKTYAFNPYITSILFMGVDKDNFSLEDNIRGTGGQADAIYLLVYNSSTGKIRIISFSRDTMVDINQYTESGKYAGVKRTQLCLAYAYGDGKELSAKNVVISLQRIIFNIPINSYFAMDLSAIKVLNNDIGGVTLTSLDTFGPFTKGETITLIGEQAETYIRTRDITILDSNIDRIERQKQYLTAFANQLIPAVQKDFSIPLDLYNDTKDYAITNLDTSKITYLASSIATSYNGLDIVNVPGTITSGEEDGKAQFTPDTEKLYELILETFYTVQ